jgi:hypothetical protein
MDDANKHIATLISSLPLAYTRSWDGHVILNSAAGIKPHMRHRMVYVPVARLHVSPLPNAAARELQL